MSKRHTILAAIDKAGVITLNELIDAVGGERKNLSDNLKACVKDDLVFRDKDEVTALPCYTLTPKGRQVMMNPPAHPANRAHRVTQAVSGANNHGSQASGPIVDGCIAEHPPEGLAVVEQPKPDEAPVEACSDVTIPPAPEYNPDAVCFDAKKREAAKDAEIEKLRSIIDLMSEEHHRLESIVQTLTTQRNAWREVAYEVECETPDGLREHIKDLQSRIATLEANEELPLNQPTQICSGYVVASANDGDNGPVFADIEDAKLAAIINAVSTGKKSAVFAMLNTVESVDVRWAA
jgi:hypothetical protein